MKIHEFDHVESISESELVHEIGDARTLGDNTDSARLARLLVAYCNMPDLLAPVLDSYRDMLLEKRDDILYDTQSIMLVKQPKYFVRANIWPNFHIVSAEASKQYEATYSYNVPHNHGFSFLTACHFGPGYTTDVSRMLINEDEYAHLKIGSNFKMSPIEQHKLIPGIAFQFDSIFDIHIQHPPEDMTITFNLIFHEDVLHVPQYVIDTDTCTTLSRPSGSAYTRQRILADIASRLGEPYLSKLHTMARSDHTEVYLKTVLEEALQGL